jgi:phage-related protein
MWHTMGRADKSRKAPIGERKPIAWVGSSYDDLIAMPEEVQRQIGTALDWAQAGTIHPSAKALSGFGGGAVLEVVENFDGDTYRAVYTIKLKDRVIVLHVFQKKSKAGARTPKADIDLVKARLTAAVEQQQK